MSKIKLASNLKRVSVRKKKNGRFIVNIKLFDVNSAMWDDEIIFELNEDDFKWINIAYKNAIHKRPLARERVIYGED